MVVIEINLSDLQWGGCPWMSAHNEGKTELMPSPVRIIRSLLSGFYQDSYIKYNKFDYLTEDQITIIEKLSSVNPNYYIPSYTHTGNISYFPDYVTSMRNFVISGYDKHSSRRISFDSSICVNIDDNSFFVFYDVTLTSTQRQLISDALQYLSYLGRSEYAAEWRILRQSPVEANCFPSDSGEVVETINPNCENLIQLLSVSPQQLKHDGYRLPPYLKISYYKLNIVRKQSTTKGQFSGGQVALISIDPKSKVDNHKRLFITNLFHRILCLKCVGNPQATGKYQDGSFLENNRSLYFITETAGEEGHICALKIICRTKIDDEIILALKSLSYIELSEVRIPVRLMGISKYQEPMSREYRTILPALLSTEARKVIHRSPEAIFINNVVFQLGYTDKIKDFIREDDGFVKTWLYDDKGWIRCKALPVTSSEIPVRGKRSAASNVGYYVIIELENPLSLISIGMHYRFGSGLLESY